MRVHDARSRAGDFTLHEHSFQLVRAPACSVGLDLYDANVAVRDFYPALEVPGVITVSPRRLLPCGSDPSFSLGGQKATTKAQATPRRREVCPPPCAPCWPAGVVFEHQLDAEWAGV